MRPISTLKQHPVRQLYWSAVLPLSLFTVLAGGLVHGEEEAAPPAVSKEVQDAVDALKNWKKASETPGSETVAATHKQARSILPMHGGQRVELHTYCVDETGDLWLCVGSDKGFVQRYSPEGELKAEIPLDFVPTAINTARGLDIFVAGNGQMARLSRAGEIRQKGGAGRSLDPEEFRKQIIEDAKAESETVRKLLTTNLKRIESTVDKVTAQIKDLTDKGEEVPKSLNIRLKLYERQRTTLQTQLAKANSPEPTDAEIAELIASRSRITALAVTDKDVFVCVSGNGYEVWRSTHDFQEVTKVLDGLSGCCGQMDIQASGDQLLVAANTRFQVAIHDREGTPISSFGKRDRDAIDGFGSCCNPMNIRCCSNGDVLCAESSIGNIKRFDASGKLVGYIGKARIGIGCKHVAVAHDDVRDRYYIMNIDKGSIVVMLPLAEAPEFTEEELAAKAASEGLGKKLVGLWSADRSAREVKRTDEEQLAATFGNSVAFEQIEFQAGGQLAVKGGLLGQYSDDLAWSAVRQDNDQLTISILMSGADWLEFQVQFAGEQELTIKSPSFPEAKATRVKADPTDTPAAEGRPAPEVPAVSQP